MWVGICFRTIGRLLLVHTASSASWRAILKKWTLHSPLTLKSFWKDQPVRITPLHCNRLTVREAVEWQSRNNARKRRAVGYGYSKVGSTWGQARALHKTETNNTEPKKAWAIRARERQTVILRRTGPPSRKAMPAVTWILCSFSVFWRCFRPFHVT